MCQSLEFLFVGGALVPELKVFLYLFTSNSDNSIVFPIYNVLKVAT